MDGPESQQVDTTMETSFETWERGSYSSPTKPIETFYKPLPANAPDIVRSVIGAGGMMAGDFVDKIEKADRYTVEIVYFNDIDATVEREDYNGNKQWSISGSKADDRTLKAIEEELQALFGPMWLVARKPDKREDDGLSRQRLWVRRVDRTDFQYTDESYVQARKMLEGIDLDAETYGGLDFYPKPSSEITSARCYSSSTVDNPAELCPLDIYAWVTSTGTVHLIRNKSLRDTAVTDDVECMCGRSVDAEKVRNGEVYHFADFVEVFRNEFDSDVQRTIGGRLDSQYSKSNVYPNGNEYDPLQVFRDDVCTNCIKDYSKVERSSVTEKIRCYRLPSVDYMPLVYWTSGRSEEIDWRPMVTDRQKERYDDYKEAQE